MTTLAEDLRDLEAQCQLRHKPTMIEQVQDRRFCATCASAARSLQRMAEAVAGAHAGQAPQSFKTAVARFVDAKPTPTAPPPTAPRAAAFHGAGKKLDKGKPRYDLLPPRATRAFVDVLTYGAEKYEANGWMKVVGWRWRYMRAGLTHAFGYLAGRLQGVAVPRDHETNLPELAHALCCFAFVLDNDLALEAGVATVPDGDAPAPRDSQEPGDDECEGCSGGLSHTCGRPPPAPTTWSHECSAPGANGAKVTMSVEHDSCVCGAQRDF